MSRFGVYIHYPWCRKRCSYCDFAISVNARPPEERYGNAIVAELARKEKKFRGRQLVSVYFGGGTPSLASIEWLSRVFAEVTEVFGKAFLREVTIEANPTDCRAGTLEAWKDLGINRVSLGVQSFDKNELGILGRDHSMGEGREALLAIADAGFQSYSADAITAVPSKEQGLQTVTEFADMAVPHISAYELTLEPKTRLAKEASAGRFTPLSEDERFENYKRSHDLLEERGYEHYEISSFATPGNRALHNSLYWTGGEYLGLGNSAASFLRTNNGAERWVNPKTINGYLDNDFGAGRGSTGKAAVDLELLSNSDVESDLIWLGLRTRDGVPRSLLSNHARFCDWLFAEELARADGERIVPTFKGFLYADTVADEVVRTVASQRS